MGIWVTLGSHYGLKTIMMKGCYILLKHLEEGLPVLFTGGMTGVTALFGGWDTAFQVFIMCVVIDMATGVVKGLVTKDFSSKRMRQGFATKFGYFVVVILATQFDKLMPEETPVLRTIAVWFYIAVESGSILENLAQMGVPVPQALIDRLAVLKGKGGEEALLGKDGKFEDKK
jgi:toxin secretion/phage lysis holin